jgi:hypothetical protein
MCFELHALWLQPYMEFEAIGESGIGNSLGVWYAQFHILSTARLYVMEYGQNM